MDQCPFLPKANLQHFSYWTTVQLDFRTQNTDNKSGHNKISPGANNARDFARDDSGRYIQHNDDLQNDRRQRGSVCQRRLSSWLRSARARGGRASRSRCLPLCHRKWRAGSALRITAKSNCLKQHKSAKRTRMNTMSAFGSSL